MHKMTKENDMEAYIESFERTVIQMGPDRMLWASQLGSLLIRKLQVAYRALPREDAYDYDTVKDTILNCLELTIEHYRQLFRARKEKEGRKPRNLI